jgi:hypothetical protein
MGQALIEAGIESLPGILDRNFNTDPLTGIDNGIQQGKR